MVPPAKMSWPLLKEAADTGGGGVKSLSLLSGQVLDLCRRLKPQTPRQSEGHECSTGSDPSLQIRKYLLLPCSVIRARDELLRNSYAAYKHACGGSGVRNMRSHA